MNAGHTDRNDENALGSAERVERFTPSFANHTDSEQVAKETSCGKDVLCGNNPPGNVHGDDSEIHGARKRNKTRLGATEKYWVDAVPAKQQGVHAFAKRAERVDAHFRVSVDRNYGIWGACDAAGKEQLRDFFTRFLKTPVVRPILTEGGVLMLASESRQTNMRNLWLSMCFGEYLGYSSVWSPSEVMDAYKSDDLYIVANQPSVLVIYLSSTDLDGSSATRRSHFLNNLSAVISARKGKTTVICRDLGGFYPNTSTFKTVRETFKQGLTLT